MDFNNVESRLNEIGYHLEANSPMKVMILNKYHWQETWINSNTKHSDTITYRGINPTPVRYWLLNYLQGNVIEFTKVLKEYKKQKAGLS